VSKQLLNFAIVVCHRLNDECHSEPFAALKDKLREESPLRRPDVSPPLFACANKLRGLNMTTHQNTCDELVGKNLMFEIGFICVKVRRFRPNARQS
jgi:hypothetical protein